MHPNIMLIILDCVRHGHLQSAGSDAVATPAIDMLASEGTTFKQAVCHAPFTTPSVTSILTGLYPFHHGVRLLVGQHLQSSIPTIAELLRAAGYRTAGFPSVFLLSRDSGLNRGFDCYDDRVETVRKGFRGPWRPGEFTTDGAVSFIEAVSGRSPFFCFLHYFDAHDYDPGGSDSLSRYNQKIGELDTFIGRLIASLRSTGVWDKTVLVITADHGDGFGEHGLYGHGTSLYDEVLRVPLIVRAPGMIPPGLTVEGQVRSIDIVPTILDLAGSLTVLQERRLSLDGASLLPLVEGRPHSLTSYAETSPVQLFTGDLLKARTFQGAEMTSLRTAEAKYIRKTEMFRHEDYGRLIGNKRRGGCLRGLKSILSGLRPSHSFPDEELYNLRVDPLELKNRAARERESSRKMYMELTDLLRGASGKGVSPPTDWTAEEEETLREKLHTIGYL